MASIQQKTQDKTSSFIRGRQSKRKTVKNIVKNYAFIDAQNLYLAIKQIGWKIDFKRFRIYLKEKYKVEKAYMFMGYLSSNQGLYTFLQEADFIIIFKPILESKDTSQIIKGNCDAELVLQAMIDFSSYDGAIIVTGDGDFYCLARHLDLSNKLYLVLAPSPKNCSSLLRRIVGKKIAFVSDLRKKLAYKKKEPHTD